MKILPSITPSLTQSPYQHYNSHTYGVSLDNKRIEKHVDGLDAVKQSIVKILSTERGGSLLYSCDYGREFDQLIGKDFEYVETELPRLIREALLLDDRISKVDNFEITQSEPDAINASFTVHTSEGNLTMNVEVNT